MQPNVLRRARFSGMHVASTDPDWIVTEVVAHHSMLTRYFRRRGLQLADAEDLRQEAYLRLLESSAARPRSGKAFVLTIARNLLIDDRRSARSRRLRLVGNLDELDRADPLDPERHVMAEADIEALCAAVTALPNRRRQVFVMRRVQNRSLREIARSLSITVKGAEQHLTQALQMLRAQVQGVQSID